jgi:methionine aminopeptidase
VLGAATIISIDSGANYLGYIGDLCRMGCVGKTDSELEDLLCWPGYKAKCRPRKHIPTERRSRPHQVTEHSRQL